MLYFSAAPIKRGTELVGARTDRHLTSLFADDGVLSMLVDAKTSKNEK